MLTQTANTPMGSMYRLFLSAQEAVRRPVRSNLQDFISVVRWNPILTKIYILTVASSIEASRLVEV